MEPIMAVWSGKFSLARIYLRIILMGSTIGYSLGGVSLAENQLAPYIQQAISQVHCLLARVVMRFKHTIVDQFCHWRPEHHNRR